MILRALKLRNKGWARLKKNRQTESKKKDDDKCIKESSTILNANHVSLQRLYEGGTDWRNV
jgi:hypothetical protein